MKENKVGIVVSSLKDIDDIFSDMSESEYKIMLDNIKPIQQKITSGGFVFEALKKAESLV